MTDMEYRLKYPIGIEIKYIPNTNDVHPMARKDIGKQGTVIGHLGSKVKIHLPTSEKRSKTWNTLWNNISLVPQKNQQLLFPFMEK